MIKFGARTKLISSSSVSSSQRSVLKTQIQKTILIAIPDSVEFHNYKSNKLYQKIVKLKNVSTSLARFQLRARPYNSRFIVMVESKSQTRIIPPGMYIKLIVFFRCNILDEPEEILMINVQHGRPIIIKLRGYRDPPILKVIHIPSYFRCPQELQTMEKDQKDWIVEIPFRNTISLKKFTSSDTNKTENIPYCIKLKSFDCGECFVGEQTILLLKVKNVGGEGRFFIMSEIDWCSMHVEDVTDKNILILQSFAIWPAYFMLKSQEHIYLYIHFFPKSHGTHVETLYIICNNCSVISTEIIGDGIMHE